MRLFNRYITLSTAVCVSILLASHACAESWGYETSASGRNATAWGIATSSVGYGTTAWGESSTASGSLATARGLDTTASGFSSTSWGEQTRATGNGATAWGGFSTASDFNATAWGWNNWATGSAATSWGRPFHPDLEIEDDIISNVASGISSTAWGGFIQADSLYSTAFGFLNISGGKPGVWSGSDPLLEVGNGYIPLEGQNALTVLKDGRIALGTHTTLDVLTDWDETVRIMGAIVIGDYAYEEDDPAPGAIRYDAANRDFKGYDGRVWKSLTAESSSVAQTLSIIGDQLTISEGNTITIPAGATGPRGARGLQGARGPAGARGLQGVRGAAGANGATWLTGNGGPINANGHNGDLYLDASSGDFYVKVSDTWGTVAGNLQGASNLLTNEGASADVVVVDSQGTVTIAPDGLAENAVLTVSSNGTISIRKQGDISMGSFL